MFSLGIIVAFIVSVYCGIVSCQLEVSSICVCMEELASGLKNPLIIENAEDGSGRIFVGEQQGFVNIFHENGTRYPELFFDISDRVLNNPGSIEEKGFLGLTFHPGFRRNGRFFVFYTSKKAPRNPGDDHVARLSEFYVSKKNRNRGDKLSEKIIMEIQEPYSNHNGGELIFGDDGYLYLFTGDGGSAGDPQGNGQNTSSLLGKVLRIDVDTEDGIGYKIPRDNPFVKNPKFRPEIYAYGVRNMWRCGKDIGDEYGHGQGRIICGDVGQDRYEEVDLIKKGGNYGWNSREGFECFQNQTCGKIGPEVLPLFAYPHTTGKCVIGGEFYRGCLNPRMEGFYIFGDFTSGKLFRMMESKYTNQWNTKELRVCSQCNPPLTNKFERNIMSFGSDESGEIYMVSISTANTSVPSGKFYRIVDPASNGDPKWCRAAKDLHRKQSFLSKNTKGRN